MLEEPAWHSFSLRTCSTIIGSDGILKRCQHKLRLLLQHSRCDCNDVGVGMVDFPFISRDINPRIYDVRCLSNRREIRFEYSSGKSRIGEDDVGLS